MKLHRVVVAADAWRFSRIGTNKDVSKSEAFVVIALLGLLTATRSLISRRE